MPIKSFMHRELLRCATIGYIINFRGVAQVVYFSEEKTGGATVSSVLKTVNLRESLQRTVQSSTLSTLNKMIYILRCSGEVLPSCI